MARKETPAIPFSRPERSTPLGLRKCGQLWQEVCYAHVTASEMLIRELMSLSPTTVAPQDTVGDARLLMERGNFRRLPVVQGERLVGVITDRDILRRVGNLG
jgi:predicted transcriptional regulator